MDWSIRVYNDLDSAREEWETFFESPATLNLMMSWQYASLWWKDFAGNAVPHIVSITDAAGKGLFVPLMKRGKDLAWIGTPDIDSIAMLHNIPEKLPDAVRALAGHLQQIDWARFHVRYLPADQWEMLCNALNLPYEVRAETTSPTIYHRGRTWDEFFASTSSKFRSDLRRKLRKIESEGIQMRFETLHDAAAVRQYFPVIREIVKLGGIPGKIAMMEGEFVPAVWQQYADCGWLELNLCFFGETVVAYSLNFTIHGVGAGMSTGYRPEYRDYTPGKHLVEYTLRQSFERGDHTFDMQHGPDEHKLPWSDEAYSLSWVTVYRTPLIQQMDDAKRTVKAFVKQKLLKRG